MSNLSTWSDGAEVVGEYCPDTDPFFYRYVCRCCGGWCYSMARTEREPGLCPACREAINQERLRRAAAIWLDSFG